jgi:hypothetical protein
MVRGALLAHAARQPGPDRAVNADVRLLLADGERALRADDLAAAREAFLEAGQCAAGYQLWRSAVRCYRRALEIDLTDREPIARIGRLSPRVIAPNDWIEYTRALDQHAWPSFSCRAAQIVTGDAGSHVECPGTGVVLEMMMTDDDLVEARPAARFAGMPTAMAMIVLRRALWLVPRELTTDPMSLRVAFDGRQQVRLDELGDWEPITATPGLQPR